jgi:hypothetical protein
MKQQDGDSPTKSEIQRDIQIINTFEAFGRAMLAMEAMDDRKLLWLVKRVWLNKLADDFQVLSFQEALLNELENRLYPEYDGDSVTYEDWGWRTPEGPLIYDEKTYRAETGI